VQRLHISGHEMEYDARMAPRETIDDSGNEARGQKGSASDPHFSDSGVGEKFDVLDALAQVIEYGHAAIEQGVAVLGRLDPLAVAVEQPHAERMLQFPDRP
jgi:hypothetical protein